VALGSFTGGVVLVSHDAHFIESVADELWVVGPTGPGGTGDGRVTRFRGEFKDYRKIALGDRSTLTLAS
jgi:ATP-binding cassette, subfamily F, member 3